MANLGSKDESTNKVTFEVEKTEPDKPKVNRPKSRSLPPPGEAFQPPESKKKSTAKKAAAEKKAPAKPAVVAKKTMNGVQKNDGKGTATK